MRGRKPVPTALHVLRGNPSKKRLPTHEPAPAAMDETSPPPDWLPDAAKREWQRVAPILARNRLLTEMDLDALAQYCHAWAVWREAQDKIQQFGLVVKTPNGLPMPSPYLPIANKAWLHLKTFMIEFGMTPSARARVVTDDRAQPGADDPFAKFDGVRAR